MEDPLDPEHPSHGAFIAGILADGSGLVYSITLPDGDEGASVARGIALDTTGIVYITGNTTAPGLNTSDDAYDPSYNGGVYDYGDAFVMRVDPSTSTPTSTSTSTSTPTSTPTSTSTSTATPTPTPTATRVSATPPSGTSQVIVPGTSATLTYTAESGFAAEIVVPTDAVHQETVLNLHELDTPPTVPGAFQFLGFAFQLVAEQEGQPVENFTFDTPIILTLNYDDEAVLGADENGLSLYYFDEALSLWRDDGITVLSREPVANRVVVQIRHLTAFALLAKRPRIYLPVVRKPPLLCSGGVSQCADSRELVEGWSQIKRE